MKHIIFDENETYKVAILIKEAAFKQNDLHKNYITALAQFGIPACDVIAFTLKLDGKKASASTIKEYLNNLIPALQSIGVTHLYVTDSSYFKVLTGAKKAEPTIGYLSPCKQAPEMQVTLGINYQALIYDPSQKQKLELGLKAIADDIQGQYVAIGSNIIHSKKFYYRYEDIDEAMELLHTKPRLVCDIETFSLQHQYAHIATISFAWSKHEGIAIEVDAACTYSNENVAVVQKYRVNNAHRYTLKRFFSSYKGELIFHKASYDIKVLIYTLFRDYDNPEVSMLEGLDILTANFHDTLIISYLATNSTAGNSLSLKSLAHEYAGNWAVDVGSIVGMPLNDLLQYNLIDTLSTFYVFEKYYPIMVQDNQEKLYKELMLPSQKLIIQIELTGMPLCNEQVAKTEKALVSITDTSLYKIHNSPIIQTLNLLIQTSEMEKVNSKLKTKQHPLSKFKDITFNPNSNPQLQKLLYQVMGLPVIDFTDTKQPATGADTIEKLINHTDNPDFKEILQALIEYNKANKILTTFIPAFQSAYAYSGFTSSLHGSFNIGGTVSGRLSSSDPNLQNLPAGSTYGKLVKKCFQAPAGWIFAGADFNSLEDYISALTTKDPNKLNVYIKGFDGHCLRAAYYFREQLGHIDLDDPKSVNSIKKTHPELRQESKAPTFALTYQGTAHTLMTNLGWDEEKAKRIEANYHELYKVSDQYVQDRLKQASIDGYVEVAFGLRVRTPLLKQVVYGSKSMPKEAAAEGRTAGNALGQSYGLLNNRAAVEFMNKVWKSKYRYSIKPVALIHDAIYLMIKDDIEVVTWANKELIASMRWQELPEIQHDTVKLGAALDLFWPTWADPVTLPNDADEDTIREICNKHRESIKGKTK